MFQRDKNDVTTRIAPNQRQRDFRRIMQSGVSDNFRMLVPIYVDLGQGWQRLGSARITGNNTIDLGNIPLPAQPRRVAVYALNDVLALSIENVRR